MRRFQDLDASLVIWSTILFIFGRRTRRFQDLDASFADTRESTLLDAIAACLDSMARPPPPPPPPPFP